MKKIFFLFVNLLLLIVVLTVWQGRTYLLTPVGGGLPITVKVLDGERLKTVLARLQRQRFLINSDWLYGYARLTKKTSIMAGSYEFHPTQTPLGILDDLQKGKVITEKLLIVEGQNRWQIRDTLAEQGWINRQEFDALCDSKVFLSRFEIPGPSCEGYIFPETYIFARGLKPEQIFETFFTTYRRNFSVITRESLGPLNFSEREFMTLASIVEKETGAAHERPRIACVFYNRLRARPQWRLDTDPTVIYAATLEDPSFDGNIKRSHLRNTRNPYNTYLYHGLPPGPISNAGVEAMKAVASPDQCRDFFFVSKNNGEHSFCPTISCHNREVKRWQIDYFRRGR